MGKILNAIKKNIAAIIGVLLVVIIVMGIVYKTLDFDYKSNQEYLLTQELPEVTPSELGFEVRAETAFQMTERQEMLYGLFKEIVRESKGGVEFECRGVTREELLYDLGYVRAMYRYEYADIIWVNYSDADIVEKQTYDRLTGTNKSGEWLLYVRYNDLWKEYDLVKGQLDEKINMLVEKAKGYAEGEEQIRYVYESIIKEMRPSEKTSTYFQSLYNIADTHTGNCLLYSDYFDAVLKGLGYESSVVYGDFQKKRVNEVIGHAWNEVKIDGKWIGYDLVFEDSEGGPEMRKYYAKGVEDEEFAKTHKAVVCKRLIESGENTSELYDRELTKSGLSVTTKPLDRE